MDLLSNFEGGGVYRLRYSGNFRTGHEWVFLRHQRKCTWIDDPTFSLDTYIDIVAQ